MSTMALVPKDDPMLVGWEAFKSSEHYRNIKMWALLPQYLEGQLWAAYCKGFADATARAGNLHEQIDPASNAERVDGLPGAGAMGAVIEYRDKIRETVAA